jgi:hypothetical protein
LSRSWWAANKINGRRKEGDRRMKAIAYDVRRDGNPGPPLREIVRGPRFTRVGRCKPPRDSNMDPSVAFPVGWE